MNNITDLPLKTTGKKKRRRTVKNIAFLLLLPALIFPGLFSFTKQNSSNNPEEFCRKFILQNTSDIIAELSHCKNITAAQKKNSVQELTRSYRKTRIAYKQIEFFVEYYSPFEAKFFINGPLVPKLEPEISSTPFAPQGFQVIEEALFSNNTPNFEVLHKEYSLLIEKFIFLREHYTTITIEQNKLADALKIQLIRIMCLTLNGYDCTINKESITECAAAIRGVETQLEAFSNAASQDEEIKSAQHIALKDLKKCRKTLLKHPDSDTFDRLSFMISCLDPAYTSMIAFFNKLKMEPGGMLYAIDFKAPSFFAANSINKQYFSVYTTDNYNLETQAELGKLLFYDPILSGNNKRACASCHKPELAFSDGLEKSLDFDASNKISRNAPTLINASYQKLYFHDGRGFNLEGQANEVFSNVHEMNSDEKDIVGKLKQSAEYRELFKNAFKNKPDSVITTYAVLKSLSEFIKKLDSRNSRFDKYLRGETAQLDKDEINGYNLFSGKALCGSCHFFPLFNGTVPPMFNDNEFEVIGVPEKMDNQRLDPDPGRNKITLAAAHNNAFKTPTVRNVGLTAPYMHNGAYNNLDSVLLFYNRGGGTGLGLDVKNQTLPFDSLGLTKKEINSLKKFLLTLSDTSGMCRVPAKLPRFENQQLNERKIGGTY